MVVTLAKKSFRADAPDWECSRIGSSFNECEYAHWSHQPPWFTTAWVAPDPPDADSGKARTTDMTTTGSTEVHRACMSSSS